ncbi:hypothetical protein EIN_047540 [Entamoeba invadens IP1]|uniref:Uncharacterized protein n=1 Tax=Entamoeba invadens IP1 TaxID=370355 RepID=A0A0A1UDP3_ENTIV|nr:hypothetical protein EIN_047540 [Entamoeba invadens IP1]ELP94461.1 hypothetical protein EIN_047540 [Entamoeba invadens IP1]|eukprot:XP_004261232.1 hypothetical protein EIN_047540 [Entamoeba invadens IP1]
MYNCMTDLIKFTKKSDSQRLCEKYMEIRNYLSCEQAFFLVLLNKKYDFVICKPTKRSLVTGQLVKLKMLHSENETLDVINFIEERCKESMNQDIQRGISETTACRRYTNNKIAENHHLLIDLLRLNGYVFNTSFSSGKHNSTKLETVVNIFFDKIVYSQKEIKTVGKAINQYFFNEIKGKREVSFQANTPTLQKFILN